MTAVDNIISKRSPKNVTPIIDILAETLCALGDLPGLKILNPDCTHQIKSIRDHLRYFVNTGKYNFGCLRLQPNLQMKTVSNCRGL